MYSITKNEPLFDNFFNPAGPHARCDVKEYDDRYEVQAELPGCEKDDVRLSLNDGMLVIEAEKRSEQDGKNIRRERYYGKISRSFGVGSSVRQEDVSASFKDGVLTVTIVKRDEEKKERYIAIEG